MGSVERIAILRFLDTHAKPRRVHDTTLATELDLSLGVVREQLEILELTGRVQLETHPEGVVAFITPSGRESLRALTTPRTEPPEPPAIRVKRRP